jgi:hypothetical protein
MKYLPLITLLNLLVAFQFLPAQAPDTLWTKTYGGSGIDLFYCVQPTIDGGYINAGYTESFGNGTRQLWIVKTDQYGDTLWTKTHGGSGDENAYSIQQTSDGGYIVAGQTNSYGLGYYDVYLLKLDTLGDTVWTKTYGGPNSDYARDVKVCIDGSYILCGGNSGDAWILKTNTLGDTTWTTTITGPQGDLAESIYQTSDGGYIAVGATGAAYGTADVLLIRLNNLGDTLWTKTLGGTGYDWAHSVIQTVDEGFAICGVTGGYAWILKTSTMGDTTWYTTIYGPLANIASSICQTTDGNYIVVGAAGGDGWLSKTDTAGSLLWSKNWGGIDDEWLLSVQQTSDGGCVTAGFTTSVGVGSRDAWLLRIKSESSHLNKKNQKMVLKNFKLNQNYPNPFNPSTTIEFDLPKTSKVTLKLFNILGEEVATLVSDKLSAGSYSYEWDASHLASGEYLYRLQAGDYVETRKMVLIR